MLHFFKSCLLVLLIIAFISSCDNNNNTIQTEELRDYAIQAAADDALLVEYLNTHFYNYEDFPRSGNSDVVISIDSIYGDNADKTPLIDQVQQISVPITDANNVITNHTLYYLIVQQGSEIDKKASLVDSTYVMYKGELLNGTEFDKSNAPVWFDNIQVVPGFRYGLQNFAPGIFSRNEDGTINFQDYGQGILMMPSGLGYYANAPAGSIPSYSSLVFVVSVFTTNESDHDNDGVLSKNEDPDGDGNPLNDDTDGDGTANLNDFDDDGDGILTSKELDSDNDGNIDDSDNDGIPDYLDPDN